MSDRRAGDTSAAANAHDALEQLMREPASLVIGPPGCGKTTAVTNAAAALGRLVRLTLLPGQDATEQIGAKLGIELSVIEALPGALKLAANKDANATANGDTRTETYLVIDDAEALIESSSAAALKRLPEHGVAWLHLVLICSSTAEPSALRRARSALPCVKKIDVALPPNAAQAAWGWAAGASELLYAFTEEDDIPADCSQPAIELILAQSLDEFVWSRLNSKQREELLTLSLDWDEDCSSAFASTRGLPALPATRIEQGRLVFCPAYKLLLEQKLEEAKPQLLSKLHAELAKRNLRAGNSTLCIEHALAADDWETLAALDPFSLLYTQDCPKLADAARVLLENPERLHKCHWRMTRFALRLLAALASAGEDELAESLYTALASHSSDPRIEQELACCRFFMQSSDTGKLRAAEAGCVDGENDTAAHTPSKAFSIDDLVMADLEGLGAQLLMSDACAQTGAAELVVSALAESFGQASLATFLMGEKAFLSCDFFKAKQLLEQALLSAEQADYLPMQRAALMLLVKLDTIQRNSSSASRFLSALEKLPMSSEAADALMLERCKGFVCTFEGKVDEVPSWLKNGTLKPGMNVAASHWFSSLVCRVFYLLKRRRVTKAKTHIDYLMAEGGAALSAPRMGCLDLLKACCALDLGDREKASECLACASKPLEKSGVLLPFAAIAALEPRYRVFVTSQAPMITQLMEANEKTALEQHVFKKDALSKPSEGLLALLTEREYEVAGMAAGGYQNKEIAARLFITERTVKEHLTRAYKKLGVPDRLALKRLMISQL